MQAVNNFRISQTTLIISVALFIAVFHNFAFFHNIAAFYRDTDDLAWILFATGLLHGGILLLLLLSLLGTGRLLRILLALVLVVSALTAYFIDTYNVIIDQEMLVNVMQTNLEESADLFSLRLIAYLLLLGLLPAWLVLRVGLKAERWHHLLLKRLLLIVFAVLLPLLTIYSDSDFFSSFLREHKSLRYYANPTKAIDSVYKSVADSLDWQQGSLPWQSLGIDAHRPPGDDDFELVVLVIGETARAENFSLNGYARPTNPELEKRRVISFPRLLSCGTTTAVSVPCMFSFQDQADYDRARAASMDNLLDVLARADIEILWRDNNTGSKGVADRVTYEDFSDPDINPLCDVECRDEGMLSGLDEWVDANPGKDLLIVLHQLGSHGPAYYKRYPERFRRFMPTCDTNELQDCSEQQIINTYDNTIVYTDYVLSQVIDWLKGRAGAYEASMLYVSDHGESLGESGLYLHGFPYALAPLQQTRVPAILWSDVNNPDIDFKSVRENRDKTYSHDNLVHTLLGLFEIDIPEYRADMDLLHPAGETTHVE